MEALDSLAQIAITRNQQVAHRLEQHRVPGSVESIASDVNFFDADDTVLKQTNHLALPEMDGSFPRSNISLASYRHAFPSGAQLLHAPAVPLNPAPTGWLPDSTLFAPITQVAPPHLPAAPTWPQDYMQPPYSTCESQGYHTVSHCCVPIVVPSVTYWSTYVSCRVSISACCNNETLCFAPPHATT